MYEDDLDDDALEPETGGPRFPILRLRDKGDTWIGMMIGYDPKAPLYEYGTRPPVRKMFDGKELTQDVLTIMVMEGTNCSVAMPREPGEEDNAIVPATPGMVAKFYIQGHNRYTQGRADAFRNAKERIGRFSLGDVVAAKFTEETLDGFGGRRLTQPKKIISFAMRRPKPEETHLVAKARQERALLKQGASSPSSATATPATPSIPVDQLI